MEVGNFAKYTFEPIAIEISCKILWKECRQRKEKKHECPTESKLQ